MTYQDTVDYLYNSTPVFEHVGASAYKEGLTTTLALDAHFGHPHRSFQTIHVAGTNGKGSCSHTLASVLQAMGKRVGLYTSPHLVDFRERIRVNGEMIPETEVIDFVEQERGFFEPLHPSFFELTTALAFNYFRKQQVDIAVIEVGLGGRLDCTNIITPILSVITNISLDHTQFLGNTLSQIAGEKAGIIKQGIPVVIGETTPETRSVFAAKAAQEGAPVIFAEDSPQVLSSTFAADGGRLYETRDYGHIHGDLGGVYQEKNTNTILNALKALGINDIQAIAKGFANVCRNTGMMGRWQRLQTQPLVICDTGHNVGGWQYLAPQLAAQPCRQMHIVFGMVDDKDIDHVMELLPKHAQYYWTQASTKRAIAKEIVAAKGKRHHLDGNCYQDVPTAYRAALTHAEKDDFIFIGGSSYVVADLLS
ncbi:MAG: folylpolyglutamate synthase/dihydrofolate synthase family protein [Prevotella sp.]|nr:folylpolyglutamate synthase/dihydrofolate synthase family protein [Prevotella sp.]